MGIAKKVIAKPKSIKKKLKKTTESKIKSLYSPVKEQFEMLAKYLEILENKKVIEKQDIFLFLDFFDYVRRQIIIYLNYEMVKLEKNGN